MDRPYPGATPEGVCAEALAEASEACGGDPAKMAKHLTTTTFKELGEPHRRYNAFRSIMTYLSIDVEGRLYQCAIACYKYSKSKDDPYMRGVAHGLAAAATLLGSPWTYRKGFKQCLTEGIRQLTERAKETKKCTTSNSE